MIPKMYVVRKKYAVLVGIVAIAWAITLCLHSLSASYYLSEIEGGFLLFAASSLLSVTAGLVIVKAMGTENFGILLTALTSFLQITTSAAMPLLFYTSNHSSENYSDKDITLIARACMFNNLRFFATAVVSVATLISIQKLIASRLHLRITVGVLCVATIILAALALVFSSSRSTIVFGVQVGFIFVGLFILNFAFIFEITGRFKIIPVISTLIGALCMIVKGETGLIAFFTTAVIAYFLFFYRRKTRAQAIMLMIFTVLSVAAVGLLYVCAEKKPSFAPDWVNVLVDKINTRIHYRENDHIIRCMESLAHSKFIGNGSDYVYVYAGTSDFAITSALRYIGIIILPLILILTVSAAFAFAHDSKQTTTTDESFLYNTAAVSFCMILVMTLYNTAMNVAAAPVIGVSCYASGLGKMHNIFCGFLFGSVLAKSCKFKSLRDLERIIEKNE